VRAWTAGCHYHILAKVHLVGGVAQWIRRRSLTDGLLFTCAVFIVDMSAMVRPTQPFILLGLVNEY